MVFAVGVLLFVRYCVADVSRRYLFFNFNRFLSVSFIFTSPAPILTAELRILVTSDDIYAKFNPYKI